MLCASIDVVPKKYRRSSGLLDAKFFLRQASRLYPNPSLPTCEVTAERGDGTVELVKIPVALFEKECEAITALAKVSGETVRETRYIAIHSAYEALVQDRVVLLSAIRHSFAHAATSLTRANVRQALTENFGGLRVDLDSHEHLKIYYRCLVDMLIAIDRALKNTLESRRSELVCVPVHSHLLQERI